MSIHVLDDHTFSGADRLPVVVSDAFSPLDDVDVEMLYELRQLPLCPPLKRDLHSNYIIILSNLLLYFTLTSGSFYLCFKVINNVLILPELI